MMITKTNNMTKILEVFKDIFYFLLLSVFISIAYKLTYVTIANTIYDASIPYSSLFISQYKLTLGKYFSSLLLAPVFETAIFVVLIHKMIRKFTDSIVIYTLVSASLFSLYHAPSGGYFIIISTLIVGVVWARSYLHFYNKLSSNNAAFAVITLHSLYNLVFLHI